MALHFIRSFLWPEISNGSKWVFYNTKEKIRFIQVTEIKLAVARYIFLLRFFFRYAEESSLHKANFAWICSGSHQAPWNLRPSFEPQSQFLTPIPQLCFSQGFIYVLLSFKWIKISSWWGEYLP